MKDARRAGRLVWGAVIFLAAIGSAVALRRMVQLVPVVIGGYRPPAATANPALAQLTALDDLFARYPILTLVHIVPGLLFTLLGPCNSAQRFARGICDGTGGTGEFLCVAEW
jgi:hypothetical protein